MKLLIPDQPQRIRALNPVQSFIVQAPAGSGKTSLLVQRYLMLLAQVNHPEEIIAITFTRKAAAEMRHRILQELYDAATATMQQSESITTTITNDSQYKNTTRQLAQKALQQNTLHRWQLLDSPHRLRIQTIDSLCHHLVSQAPLASGLHTAPNIATDQEIDQYYLTAAQALISELEDTALTPQQHQHLKNTLLYFDNDIDRFIRLCIDMLHKREQWLPYIVDIKNFIPATLRQTLENSLATVINEAIVPCQQTFPSLLQDEIINLLEFSIKSLKNFAAEAATTNVDGLASDLANHLLAHNVDFKRIFFNINSSTTTTRSDNHLAYWQYLTDLLLTSKGEWRKVANKNIGFPAASQTKDKEEKALYDEMKRRHKHLIDELQKHPELQHNLQEIQRLPAPTYTETQWQIICSLIELLPLLAAHLELVFQTAGKVDYTAVALAAEHALGSNEQPTELALNLDYRIKHLLVDEFQDISLAQYRLITKLTVGWENGDGRTLFLVGDPMQSIYRFRQAEVGLFIRTARDGIGSVTLEALQLTNNFRSTPSIIAWLNENFAKIMPQFPDIALGSIPFCAAQAAQNDAANSNKTNTAGVKVHALLKNENDFTTINNTDDCDCPENEDDSETSTNDSVSSNYNIIVDTAIQEAQYVRQLIEEIQHNNSHEKIAILVSARNHLRSIIPELKAANIAYTAVKLETLNSSSIIQDLFSLTRALTNLADRIAWLAILRAPWCGLCLGDLHALATASEKILWDNLCNNQTTPLKNLSHDGQQRLTRILPILQDSLYNRGRQNFRDWIETTWLNLGGPACIENTEGLKHADQFFKLLETLTGENNNSYCIDLNMLAKKLETLYLESADIDAQVQISTIHQAKGLEFDHVIVCGLERAAREDRNQLLMWWERPRQHGEINDLLLAPHKTTGEKKNAIYRYLQYIEQQKDYYETGRLLYVAATRAKKSLHLIGSVQHDNAAAHKNAKKDAAIEQTAATTTQMQAAIKAPGEKTLLYQLWSCFNPQWLKTIAPAKTIMATNKNAKIITTRLASDWQSPLIMKPASIRTPATQINAAQELAETQKSTTPIVKVQHPKTIKIITDAQQN